jgi:hypothetical protein
MDMEMNLKYYCVVIKKGRYQKWILPYHIPHIFKVDCTCAKQTDSDYGDWQLGT